MCVSLCVCMWKQGCPTLPALDVLLLLPSEAICRQVAINTTFTHTQLPNANFCNFFYTHVYMQAAPLHNFAAQMWRDAINLYILSHWHEHELVFTKQMLASFCSDTFGECDCAEENIVSTKNCSDFCETLWGTVSNTNSLFFSLEIDIATRLIYLFIFWHCEHHKANAS